MLCQDPHRWFSFKPQGTLQPGRRLRFTKVNNRLGTNAKTVQLVGSANEAEVQVGQSTCLALVDSGSQVSTVAKWYFDEHMHTPMEEIDEFLNVEGAGGNQLGYLVVAETSLGVPETVLGKSVTLEVPFRAVNDTDYNSRAPVIIGTNVINLLLQDDLCTQPTDNLVWETAVRSAAASKQSVAEDGKISAIQCMRQTVIPPQSRPRPGSVVVEWMILLCILLLFRNI